mmetsp:Transcript_42171/g.127705  ORF Transcript_42171/g.127705 Transcript_42171/m.127705 type:complete len:523 (+) Transcript_42171:83-1651(+)
MASLLALLGLLVGASGAPVIVLDDADAAARLQGAVRCEAAGHAGAFHHNNGSSGNSTAFATYDFNVSKSGCYLLEEYHPTPEACGGLALHHVPLIVDYCKGLTAWTLVRQDARGNAWNALGRLPFFVGWPGRLTLSRQGLPERVCPDGRCFWAADAFRLTWLAETCHEAERQASAGPTAREQAEAELEGQAVEEPQAAAQPVSFVVQAVLNEPQLIAQRSTFSFLPPLDGCYVVEERHPHVPQASKEPLEIAFCRGRVARGQIDHTDGRHQQWNYVASLPFDEDENGSITLPRGLLEQAEDHPGIHEFRLTHVGPRCSARAAQVHTAELRITANFSLVEARLTAFKAELAELLADASGVDTQRLSVSRLAPGSILAEVSVLPAAVAPLGGAAPSAAEAVANLKAALPGLRPQVCSAAGASGPGCDLTVLRDGPAQPMAVYTRQNAQPADWSPHGTEGGLEPGIIAAIAAAAGCTLLLVAVAGCCIYKARCASQRAPAGKQIEDPTNPEEAPEAAKQAGGAAV